LSSPDSRTAICPGSFDPVTVGHIDIIQRATRLFDQVIVAVGVNPEKDPLFTLRERCEILESVCEPFPNVKVAVLEGLLVQYARRNQALVVVKGLRAISDFEFEFQQALMNSHIEPNVETVFLMTRPEHAYLSSSMIKNVFALGGPISGLVPQIVERRMEEKIRERSSKIGKNSESDSSFASGATDGRSA
jgi:pantetheine-phosphate adenylyltransferase